MSDNYEVVVDAHYPWEHKLMKGVIYMSKIYIRTSDIFNIEDAKKRMMYFNFCHEKALKCGLTCKCHIEGKNTTLFMEGSKLQYIKYYLATLLKTKYKTDGIKRLISIIFT